MAEPAGVPAAEYSPLIHVHDVDELNHAVSGSDLEVVQLKPGRLDVTLSQWSLGALSIDVGTINVALRVAGGLDSQRFSLGAFAHGTRAQWNGNPVDASQLLFFTPGKELNGHVTGGYGWTSVVVPFEWISAIAATARRPERLQLATDCRMFRPTTAQLAEFQQAVAQVLSAGGKAVDAATEVWLHAEMRNALGATLSTLDLAPLNPASRAHAHFRTALRAERYLRERLAEPVCIDEMCVAMHTSRRYLEYAFADAFGTSPSHYLRLLRLHQVRRRLRSAGRETTVTDEAIRLGFNHLSQFSAQYKKAFGESPTVTLARAR